MSTSETAEMFADILLTDGPRATRALIELLWPSDTNTYRKAQMIQPLKQCLLKRVEEFIDNPKLEVKGKRFAADVWARWLLSRNQDDFKHWHRDSAHRCLYDNREHIQ